MNGKSIVQTERLLIREFEEGDLDPLAAMLSDPDVMRFSVNGVMSREKSLNFLKSCMEQYQQYGYSSWTVETLEDKSFVGFVGLAVSDASGDPKAVDIGYRLAKHYWGKGFATEATRAIVKHGFQNLGIQKITCVVIPEHDASIKVAEKIGFSDFIDSEEGGLAVRRYEMTQDEWPGYDV